MKRLAAYVNQLLHAAESHLRVASLQRTIKSCPNNILDPRRVILREGRLKQIERTEGGKERRHHVLVLLFNDAALILRRRLIFLPGAKYEFVSLLSLPEARVTVSETSEREFSILSSSGDAHVRAASAHERDSWVRLIGRTIQNTTSNLLKTPGTPAYTRTGNFEV